MNMPKVLFINGYRFFFFSNEGNPTEPCHIHVKKNTCLAKFWITSTAVLADSYGFTAEELNEIKEIANNNIKHIQEAWNEFFSGKR